MGFVLILDISFLFTLYVNIRNKYLLNQFMVIYFVILF